MSSNNIHVFFLISMVWFLTLINNEYALDFRGNFCSNTTTFQINSTYQSNLNHLLSTLISNSSNTTGFYYTSVGQEAGTQVHGSFLCRGDVSPGACENCVKTAVKKSTEELCPIEKVAVIWYDECMLRYSNESYIGIVDESVGYFSYNNPNVTGDGPEKFEELLAKTMDELEAKANEGSIDGKKYATKEVKFSNYLTFYNLVQCTPDLSSLDCKKCLTIQVNQLPNCCGGKQGANVMNPSCNVRYESYQFYNIQPSAPTPGPELSPPQSKVLCVQHIPGLLKLMIIGLFCMEFCF